MEKGTTTDSSLATLLAVDGDHTLVRCSMERGPFGIVSDSNQPMKGLSIHFTIL